jgi:hypothetical protein
MKIREYKSRDRDGHDHLEELSIRSRTLSLFPSEPNRNLQFFKMTRFVVSKVLCFIAAVVIGIDAHERFKSQ